MPRPQSSDLSQRLYRSALHHLARHGYAACKLAAITLEAKTSKQAIYRRWPHGKQQLAIEALRFGFSRVPYQAAGSASFDEELDTSYAALQHALTHTPLGLAYLTCLGTQELRPTCQLLLAEQRIFFRQIYLYWGRSHIMEAEISQRLSRVFFQCILEPAIEQQS
ncbi:TetR/AcrR family transcriptional regulator [Polycladidibacter hongkongensis]|uniref:TetR/AcrR family transcriptional regulator n=1 Tax=Polycladidibacter hongkongensis TaxID=1647556 RepID=UPI00082E2A67|nr:TetR/AcrR family transcriptional regulator [Pseudovibrio hongkongensis]